MSEVRIVWQRIGVRAELWEKLEEVTKRLNRSMPEEPPISAVALAGAIIGSVVLTDELSEESPPGKVTESELLLQELAKERRKGNI
jgi:hypothetical protein